MNLKTSKGMELAISTIAIIVMVLLVVLVVVEFFMGGFGAGTIGITTISNQTNTQAGQLNITSPKYRCTGTAHITDDACDAIGHSEILKKGFAPSDTWGWGIYPACIYGGLGACAQIHDADNHAQCVLRCGSKDDVTSTCTGSALTERDIDCTRLNSPRNPNLISAEEACNEFAPYGCKWEYS